MSDTDQDNGVHETHEHDHGSFDAGAQANNMGVIERAAHAERAQHVARIDQLIADRNRLDDQIATERAHVQKCDAILGWQSKPVRARGKRKSQPVASKGKR